MPSSVRVLLGLCVTWSMACTGQLIWMCFHPEPGQYPLFTTESVLYCLMPVMVAASCLGGLGFVRWFVVAWIVFEHLWAPYLAFRIHDAGTFGDFGISDGLATYLTYVALAVLDLFPSLLFGVPVFVLSLTPSARDYFVRTRQRRRLLPGGTRETDSCEKPI